MQQKEQKASFLPVWLYFEASVVFTLIKHINIYPLRLCIFTMLFLNAHMGQYGWDPNSTTGVPVCVSLLRVNCMASMCPLSLPARVLCFCAVLEVWCCLVSHMYQCLHHCHHLIVDFHENEVSLGIEYNF